MVTLPLILLAIPSMFVGWFTVKPMLYGDWFGEAIHVQQTNNVLEELGRDFHTWWQAGLEGFGSPRATAGA